MFSKVKVFLTEVKTEMAKVTWSSRAELVNSTAIVLVSIVFLSLFIGIVDFVCSQVFRFILG